ncbi:hypothetical protein C8F04DRAFT_1116055 [Mycena alexandri]|uniref:Uncharacterized protein n=1 Tax=Mycena alexandri TaxID=1745969 RepID=A0AAD6SQ03_9AGAR|nr:hypothetical protein C8F04DRAFT_1116055 [Mycena alexandri]
MKLSPSALSFTIQLSLAVVVLAQTQSTTRTFNSFPGDTTDVSDSIPLSTTTIFVTASFPAFSTTVGIPQPEASPAVVPNTDKTPVDEGPQPSHLRAQVVIGVITGLAILGVLDSWLQSFSACSIVGLDTGAATLNWPLTKRPQCRLQSPVQTPPLRLMSKISTPCAKSRSWRPRREGCKRNLLRSGA